MASYGEQPPDRRALVVFSVVVVVGFVAALGAARSEGLEWENAGDGVAPTSSVPDVSADALADERTTPHFVPTPSGTADSGGARADVSEAGTRRGPSRTDPATAEQTLDNTTAPTAPPQDADVPSVVARPVPMSTPNDPPPSAPPPPWAGSTYTTSGGHVSTLAGCLQSGSSSPPAAELDAFFAHRVGPVIGWDYQHTYPLGGDRTLWLFQDAFVDHSGGAATLGQASFAHNVALLQEGGCFRLLHRGSTARPEPFETGTGSRTLSSWYWPMGGEVHGGRLQVFWVRMVKDAIDPSPPDGLGWHPADTWIASYDSTTLARTDFRRSPNPGVSPIYGYAAASDGAHTYLFGNTFEQNLAREGGYWSGRHSATRMYLARVPLGQLSATPEYRTSDGWTGDPGAAIPILDRHWAEFPFQPRYLDGQWVGVAAVNGYWGDEFSVDVANEPWGPWTTVESHPIRPRAGDPTMNTYHAQLAPWRDAAGNLVVTMSNNARDMRRDAWPHPHRYRPMAFLAPWAAAPSAVPSTTVAPSIPPTTAPPPTTATTTSAPAPTTTAPTTATTTITGSASTSTAPSTSVSSASSTTTAPTTAAAQSTTVASTDVTSDAAGGSQEPGG
ncbi:MAG: hypothetical protein QNM02_03025 [Acidimicrobiia bacterium]|nr:hypothetical protein [Acidimicrobiia bacterium]